MDASTAPSNEPTGTPLKVLFAASEALPLIKTGGLADVAGSLPRALRELGDDVRLILPAYPAAISRIGPILQTDSVPIRGCEQPVRILHGSLPGGGLRAYLVDAPWLFDRPGSPYVAADGHDWTDNPQRFALFCRAIVECAQDRLGLHWRPDIVHCNDWQTGLVAPLLQQEPRRPAALFTIHNLAYQGLFAGTDFQSLGLPAALWSDRGLEFHRRLSFIKGGIAFSDLLTTVSPTYACEIRTAEFGYGLEGLLQHLGSRLVGVLNGIDDREWDPGSDPAIVQPFDEQHLHLKGRNKLALQEEVGLPRDEKALLLGHIGRLVEQKGVDLILDVLPGIMELGGTQMVLLGSGDRRLEDRLLAAAERYPDRVAVHLGYNEDLSHRIEAASDCFLMPSRFEPCGLNQLYSLRYGAIPVVRRTGGLADTVVNASEENLRAGTATGFVFDNPDSRGLWDAVTRMAQCWNSGNGEWQQIAITGMHQDFSWSNSARHYRDLYHRAIREPMPNPLV